MFDDSYLKRDLSAWPLGCSLLLNVKNMYLVDVGIVEDIIESFEENAPIPTSVDDWGEDAEAIALYLAAKKYVERHG